MSSMFLLIKEVASPGADGQPASSASSAGPRLAFCGRFGVLGLGGFAGSGGGLLPALGTVNCCHSFWWLARLWWPCLFWEP